MAQVIYNISYKNKRVEREIKEEVGEAFSFFKKLKLKGVGSQRFEIKEASFEIGNFLTENILNFCNIELLKKGIILRFRYRNETYALPVAYRKLIIYQTGSQITLYKNSAFVRLIPAHNQKLNQKFMQKMQDFKYLFTPEQSPI